MVIKDVPKKTAFDVQSYSADVADIVKSSIEDGFHLRE
jgi:hypothetical protein